MSDLIYIIKLVHNGQESQFNLDETKTIGSIDDMDISVIRAGLSKQHGRFSIQNGVLTYTHQSKSAHTLIGSQKCEAKKMYILDEGDELTLGELKATIIKGEKLEAPEVPDVPEQESSNIGFELDLSDSFSNLQKNTEEENDNTETNQISDDEPDGQTLIGIEIFNPSAHEDTHTQADVLTSPPSTMPRPKSAPPKPRATDKAKAPLSTRPQKQGKLPKTPLKLGKKPKYKKSIIGLAGTVPRIVGNLYNIIIFGLAFYYFDLFEMLPTKQIATLLSEVLAPVAKMIPIIPQDLITMVTEPETLYVLVSLALWNLITTLIFTVPFGQWAIGLHAGNDVIKSRLFSVVREMISFVTTPLMIFDLTLLIKKRSLKETLTQTHVSTYSSSLTFLLAAIVVPTTILFSANYNIIFNSDVKRAILHSQIKTAPGSILKPSNKERSVDSNPSYFASKSFGLVIKNYFSDNFTILTKAISENKSKMFTYYFYDKGTAKYTQFNHENVLLGQELIHLLKKDPLLSMTSPEIYSSDTKTSRLNDAIIPYVYNVLNLSKTNLIQYAVKNGIFLYPHFEAKSLLLKKIGFKSINDLKVIKFKGRRFLSFTDKTKKVRKFLVVNDLGIASFTMENNPTNDELINRILTRSTPFDPKKQNYTITPEQILYQISVKEPLQREESEIMTRYYTDIARKALAINKDGYTKLVLEIFKSNEKALLSFERRNNDKNISELRLVLNRVQKALYKRETEFFELNK